MAPLIAPPPASDESAPTDVDVPGTSHEQRVSAIKAAFIGTFIEWFDYAA
ncbi:hypothetical protein QPX48_03895 [Corynebacterium accolens]|uniref:Uncharacterized protein n=2 Tax=Corynebacterium TaxID=1716 RepID=A0AAP4C021_9CORY|nr:hypothetical protein [Corynebacterium accolens]MDK4310938.1 hypothetical protein [Corynebacterium accolens]MDK4335220.1 hypothetical protein [Corynebacterium accolens]MDK4337365.1 hypothetical protein [Corynebacterium accolens]